MPNLSLPDGVIAIVSGLPRSGTSMMMHMLQAGGLEVLADENRPADPDNPQGYAEYAPVKHTGTDHGWLEDARGKVVKVISHHLTRLPTTYTYHIIFMQRAMPDILASQQAMLARRGQNDGVADSDLAKLYETHLRAIGLWLADQPHISVLPVSYEETLRTPAATAKKLSEFFGGGLDLAAMATIVDAQLHRQQQGPHSRVCSSDETREGNTAP